MHLADFCRMEFELFMFNHVNPDRKAELLS